MRRVPPAATALAVACLLSACSDKPAPVAPRIPAVSLQRVHGSGSGPVAEPLDVPLPGLTAGELSRFNQGRAVFQRVFDQSTGLGPLFNSNSCAGCHEDPNVGGVGDDLVEDIETHVSVAANGSCSDLASVGGVVIQQHTTALLQAVAPGRTFEPIPPEAGLRVARRSTPALFGFGLLEAIPTQTILALERFQQLRNDGVSGRAHRVGSEVGRFGRKATDPGLLAFNAGAFMMEMGISNPLQLNEQPLVGFPFPYPASADPTPGLELSGADLALVTDFVRFLRPPPALKATGSALVGEVLFALVGCATCHTPVLLTGPNAVQALSRQRVAAFTDLLLHDMGPGLADICRGQAQPAEFRTEPLMGLRFREHFLHDARANSVEDAILQHGGEATWARRVFQELSGWQRAALLAYLGTL